MKTKIYILVLIFLAIMGILNAQTDSQKIDVKLSDFNFYFWNAYATKLQLSPAERNEFLTSHKNNNFDIQQKLNTHQPSVSPANSRSSQPANVFAAGCTNIDFENGSLSGWAPWSGFHPLYAANPSGCCLIPGGQQTIMTGTGLDPAGNFPVVAPGGNFSLRLGNNQTGGQADRIEQTFLVTSANANFTYRYAVVMEDPGHVLSQQPSFQVEMLDSLGAQIPCTFYNVAAGNNIPGFIASTTMANVVYKPWSSVVADLTSLIGQNITIRFTTYDCSLGGHFGYAYIDGSCMSFVTGSNDTICPGTQKLYCAPNGFLTTTWNGPGIINNTNQCINASAPGVYTCQTVLVPGCPGPNFTYTLSNFPKPTAAFSSISNSACSPQYTFINTSTISAGSISTYTWNFYNGTSNLQNPTYNFPAPGNYTVSLTANSTLGCQDKIVQNITIYPFPVAGFITPPVCASSVFMPVNTSSIALGSVNAYTWNSGNGNISNLSNPAFTYSNSGNYLISLTVSSDQNCVSTQTNIFTVYPKPNASFNSVTLNNCAPQFTFTNTSNISSGNITGYNWNFGNATSTVPNPVNNFPAPGNYTVSLVVTSGYSCKDTAYKSITIYPFPNVTFVSQAVCLNSVANFSNLSTISLGSINSYTWNFGNGNNSAVVNPNVNYTNSGAYTVSLSATSNQNCVSTATGNIIIYPLPSASISAANFCLGNTTAFLSNSNISSGSINSFAWNFGDGNTSNLALPLNQYAGSGTYLVSLLLTSNQNCAITVTSNVTIHPLPVLTFSVANICHGNSTMFSNSSSIVSGSIVSYTWSFGNNITSSLSNPTLTYLNSGSYVVGLTAKSNFNCMVTTTSNLVIHPVPIISFSPTNVCLGDTTAFTNNNAITSGNMIGFTWNFGDGSTSNAINPFHKFLTYGIKLVTLSATSNQNCTSTYTNNLTIHPRPIVAFTANNVCRGFNTNFVNSSTIPVGNISNWNWDYGNGQTVTGISNPIYQYPIPGTYSVTLTATSNNNCSNTSNKIVQVFANPTASFVANNLCLSAISTFTNLSIVASPEQITSYNWTLGNGSNSNFTNPVLTYSNPGNYTVKLSVGTSNNCTNSYMNIVTVYALPQVAFIPTSACKNQPTQFTNLSTLNSGIISKCRWDFENDGNWDDTLSINPIITYPNHGIYSCKLEVESSFQCKGNSTKNVAVHANPVADFSTRAVCLGDVTTFNNKSTSVDDVITSYLWDFNGDNVVDNVSQNASYTYSANGTYLVKLEVQTTFGCSNVKSKSGHINAMPQPGFVSKNNQGCPLLKVNFQNTSSISTGSIISTLWSFGDGSPTDYSQNPGHIFNVGNYNITLKVVSDSGCAKSLTQPGFVNVYPQPVAGFKVEPDEIDETEPLGNIQSNAQDAVFTSYYINDGSRINAANFTHTFKNLSETKPLIVQIVKNEFGCADTAMEILKVKPAFAVYIPNTFTPNGDGLNDNFQAKGVGITKFNMQIFDRWGHILYETADILNPWDGTVKGGDQPIMQDVYVWKAQVIDLFNKNHDLTGHVSVIR